MSYYCLRLMGVPNGEIEAISEFCFDAGASGIEENLAFSQPNLEYEAKELAARFHSLVVYFEDDPSILFGPLQDKFPAIEVSLSEEQERDWLAEWKKGFHPFRLCGKYWVVPSWMKPPPEAERPLVIDPGMAFGTGHHATTQLCSFLLVNEMMTGEIKSVIDVGTGTGILAMLAHYEGASTVEALDVDPEARRVARENLALNKIDKIQLRDDLLPDVSDHYDLVVANIIDGVLLKLKADLLGVRADKGRLVLGGILLEREPEFIEAFLHGTGLKILQRLVKDEWVAYTLG